MALFNLESPWLGALAGMLNKLIKFRIGLWISKGLSAVGLGFVADKFIWQPLIDQAVTAWQGVPAIAANWMHALGFDTAISILLSAYGIRHIERVFLSRKYEPPV